jgi:hypothetical protein
MAVLQAIGPPSKPASARRDRARAERKLATPVLAFGAETSVGATLIETMYLIRAAGAATTHLISATTFSSIRALVEVANRTLPPGKPSVDFEMAVPPHQDPQCRREDAFKNVLHQLRPLNRKGDRRQNRRISQLAGPRVTAARRCSGNMPGDRPTERDAPGA